MVRFCIPKNTNKNEILFSQTKYRNDEDNNSDAADTLVLTSPYRRAQSFAPPAFDVFGRYDPPDGTHHTEHDLHSNSLQEATDGDDTMALRKALSKRCVSNTQQPIDTMVFVCVLEKKEKKTCFKNFLLSYWILKIDVV